MVFCVAAAYACSASNSNSPGPPTSGGDDASLLDSTQGLDTSTGGDSNQGDAPMGDGALDASGDHPGDGAVFDVFPHEGSSGDAQVMVPCGPSPMWGMPNVVLTTSAADATLFGGITPDELSIAWTSTTGGVVTAWIADRASNTAAFGTPQALSSSFGALAFDRVSLSGDGLRIVGVRADTTGFVAATRAARPGTFDTDDGTEFAGFLTTPDASTYASPLLSPDDQVFMFVLTSSASNDDLVFSGGPNWNKSQTTDLSQLARVGSLQRRPTGMTMDELTLFYWDDVSGTEKVAYGDPFAQFADLGAWKNASPTGTCSRIYYSVPASDGGGGAITIVYVGSSGM
jgi:hypothetical protein